FQAEDGIRDRNVTGVQTCALPISPKVGAIIGLAILAFYSVGGGIIASVYTDLFQGMIMIIVSVFVFFFAINIGGGFQEITETLQSSDLELATLFGNYPMISIVC